MLGKRQGERIAATERGTAEANGRAADANRIAEQERLARVQLEARLAPRNLSGEQQARIRSGLAKLAGQYVTVVFNDNFEAANFAVQIESAIRSANWVVTKFSSLPPGSGLPVAKGVLIMTEPPEQSKVAASALLSALTKEGVAASVLPLDRKKGAEEDLYLNSSDPIYKRVLVIVGDHP